VGETRSEEVDHQQVGGGGEVVSISVSNGCRGICDDSPVEAGGAAT